MSRFFKVDLQQLCNHKMFYEKEPNPEEKIDSGDVYVLSKDMQSQSDKLIDGSRFSFNFDKKDNVVCEGQRLKISVEADKLHVIGFTAWGDTNEIFQVIYEDGGTESVQIPFIDWKHSIYKSVHISAWFGENITKAIQASTFGELKETKYIHHSFTSLKGDKKIEEIVFPDNFLIHILAITFEKSKK